MNEKMNISDQLSAYLDGELDQATTQLVAEALKNDPALAKELDELRATRQLVRESLPGLRAPINFAERVAQAAAEKQAGKNARPTRWTFGKQTLTAAAVVLFAIGAGLIISHQMNRHMLPPQPDDTIVAISPQAETDVDKYGTDMADAQLYKELVDDVSTDGEAIASLDMKTEAKSSTTFGREKIAIADAPKEAMDELSESREEAEACPVAAAVPAQPTGAPMVVLRSPAPAPVQVGGTVNNISPAREMAKAKNQPNVQTIVDGDVVELADRSRAGNNEIVWTDNMRASQQALERTIISNGFELAPEKQNELASNQAINLNNSFSYNQARRRSGHRLDKQIEYLVVGDEKQIDKLRQAIRNNLQQQQRVSQLPEPLFRRALQAQRVTTTQTYEYLAGQQKQDAPATPRLGMKKDTHQSPAEISANQQTMLITLNFRSQANLNRAQADAIRQAEMENSVPPMPISQPAKAGQ